MFDFDSVLYEDPGGNGDEVFFCYKIKLLIGIGNFLIKSLINNILPIVFDFLINCNEDIIRGKLNHFLQVDHDNIYFATIELKQKLFREFIDGKRVEVVAVPGQNIELQSTNCRVLGDVEFAL